MDKIKILVATHKEFDFPQNDIFLPIQAGKRNAEIKLDIQGDDEGDNISEKNSNYCELTAYYWAWKNLDTDIIGFYHYRRYFDLRPFSYSMDVKKIKGSELEKFLSQTSRDISKSLANKDMVLAKRIVSPYSMFIYYSAFHVIEDLRLLTDVINTLHPNYMPTWMHFLNHNNKFSAYNMLICKKDNFDKYCEWLFPILFEVEKRIKFSPSLYQQRVFGFMAERLLNLYCYHNKLKINLKPVLLIIDQEEKRKGKIIELVDTSYSYIGDRLTNISFYISNHNKRYSRIKEIISNRFLK